jgi:uncharacterized membrane protein
MYKTTVARHPLHPMLIVGPAGLLPFSLAMDMMHRSTGEESYNHAAYHSMSAGIVTALAAGAAGAVDYMSIPDDSPTKRTGTTHGVMNIGLVAMYGLNLAMRSKDERPSGLCLALSALGTAGLLVSAWFGGHMVYDQGMRVKGRSEVEHAQDLKIPGDDAIADALERIGT